MVVTTTTCRQLGNDTTYDTEKKKPTSYDVADTSAVSGRHDGKTRRHVVKTNCGRHLKCRHFQLRSTCCHNKGNLRPPWNVWRRTRSSHNCITRIRPSLPSAHVTPQIPRIPSPHEPRKNCIVSQAVVDSRITGTLSSRPKTVYSLTAANSPLLSAHTPQFPKPRAASPLIAHYLNFSALCISTSHSGIVCPSGAATIGVLVSNLSIMMISLQVSWRSGPKPVASLAKSGATVMRNCLAATSVPSYTLNNHPLRPVPQDVNLQMVLLSRTGRLWCICPALT